MLTGHLVTRPDAGMRRVLIYFHNAALIWSGHTHPNHATIMPYPKSFRLLLGLPLALAPLHAETIPANRPPASPVVYNYNTSPAPGKFYSDVEPAKYQPDYQPGVTSFDLKGRPYLRKGTRIQTINDAKTGWEIRDAYSAIKNAYPNWNGSLKTGAYADERVLFDSAGHAYTYMDTQYKNSTINTNLLLFSTDGCRTWKIYPLAQSYTSLWQIQDATTNYNLPPALLLHYDGGAVAANSHMKILSLAKTGSGTAAALTLSLINLSSVTAGTFGPVLHSGGSQLCSSGNNYYLAWGSRIAGTQPAVSPQVATGTATYITTINRSNGTNTGATFLGYSGDTIDGHNIPALTTTSNGRIHVVVCGHNDRRMYLKTSASANSTASFAAPEYFATEAGGKTYASVVCSRYDVLQCAFRYKQDAVGYFLGHCAKNTATGAAWTPISKLVSGGNVTYDVWRNQISFNKSGNAICLSFSYSPNYLNLGQYNAYLNTWPGDNLQAEGPPASGATKNYSNIKDHWPALLTSNNGGGVWNVPSTANFISAMQP
jgi:BNR repeat-containing family member